MHLLCINGKYYPVFPRPKRADEESYSVPSEGREEKYIDFTNTQTQSQSPSQLDDDATDKTGISEFDADEAAPVLEPIDAAGQQTNLDLASGKQPSLSGKKTEITSLVDILPFNGFGINTQSAGRLCSNPLFYTVRYTHTTIAGQHKPVLYLSMKEKVTPDCMTFRYFDNVNQIKPDRKQANWGLEQTNLCRFSEPKQIIKVIDWLLALGWLQPGEETKHLLQFRDKLHPDSSIIPIDTNGDFSFMHIKSKSEVRLLLHKSACQHRADIRITVSNIMAEYNLKDEEYHLVVNEVNEVLHNLSGITPQWVEIKKSAVIEKFMCTLVRAGLLDISKPSANLQKVLKPWWSSLIEATLLPVLNIGVKNQREAYEEVTKQLSQHLITAAFQAVEKQNVDLLYILIGGGLAVPPASKEGRGEDRARMAVKSLASNNATRIEAKFKWYANEAILTLLNAKNFTSDAALYEKISGRLRNVMEMLLASFLEEFDAEAGDYCAIKDDETHYIWSVSAYSWILHGILNDARDELLTNIKEKIQRLPKRDDAAHDARYDGLKDDCKMKVEIAQKEFNACYVREEQDKNSESEDKKKPTELKYTRPESLALLAPLKDREKRLQKILHANANGLLPSHWQSVSIDILRDFLRQTRLTCDKLDKCINDQGIGILEHAVTIGNPLAVFYLVKLGMSVATVDFSRAKQNAHATEPLLTPKELEKMKTASFNSGLLDSAVQKDWRNRLSRYEPELDKTQAALTSFLGGLFYNKSAAQERIQNTRASEQSLQQAQLAYNDEPLVADLERQQQRYTTGGLGRSKYHSDINTVISASRAGRLHSLSASELTRHILSTTKPESLDKDDVKGKEQASDNFSTDNDSVNKGKSRPGYKPK